MQVIQVRRLLAVAGATLPLVGLLIWMRLLDQSAMTLTDLLLYPLIFGGGAILLILALDRYLGGDSRTRFNHKPGALPTDIGHGLLLFLIFATLAVIQQFTVNRWLPFKPPAPEIVELINGLSRNPLLLAIWLGPVVWIGVALFEELFRAFFLKTLWDLRPSLSARWIVIVISAALIGGLHSYQGWVGVIGTGVLSLIAGGYYLHRGRLLPLVIAHALYDSAWIVFGIVMMDNQG